ncbi:MAG: HAMP domain-containing sensor histidine kinase, partial [Actinomycetes bacterium]
HADRDDGQRAGDDSAAPSVTAGPIRISDSLPDGSVAAVFSDERGVQIATGPQAPPVTSDQLTSIANASPGPNQPFSYPLDDDAFRWITTTSEGHSALTGLPLEPVDQTIGRLTVLMAIVGGLALVGVAGGGYLVVRRGLRPLGRLADGARAIADSDLEAQVGAGRQRLSLRREQSSAEVAELSAALSSMLEEIDNSIAARDQANERLRRFVADASHELRTPLASIRAYSELLRRGLYRDGEQSDLFLGRIESESVRLGALVNDLLLLARLDQGRALAQEPVDVMSVIDDAVCDLLAAEPARLVQVRVAADTNTVIVADADRLRQVFTNLLANIRVHTPTEAAVTISVEAADSDLVVAVADEGPGIPEQAQESIFDRFSRADSGRAREQGGSGLGLAIVQSVVLAHGGAVSLSSSASGTTITLRLPIAGETQLPAGLSADAAPAAQ